MEVAELVALKLRTRRNLTMGARTPNPVQPTTTTIQAKASRAHLWASLSLQQPMIRAKQGNLQVLLKRRRRESLSYCKPDLILSIRAMLRKRHSKRVAVRWPATKRKLRPPMGDPQGLQCQVRMFHRRTKMKATRAVMPQAQRLIKLSLIPNHNSLNKVFLQLESSINQTIKHWRQGLSIVVRHKECRNRTQVW